MPSLWAFSVSKVPDNSEYSLEGFLVRSRASINSLDDIIFVYEVFVASVSVYGLVYILICIHVIHMVV